MGGVSFIEKDLSTDIFGVSCSLSDHYFYFFAKRGFSLPIEYYGSIKGLLSDSYSVISQVWMLFI